MYHWASSPYEKGRVKKGALLWVGLAVGEFGGECVGKDCVATILVGTGRKVSTGMEQRWPLNVPMNGLVLLNISKFETKCS